MKHTECKDCKLREGDCGHHFKMDGITDYDIPKQSSCDQYDNCMFFQPNSKRTQGDLISRSELKKAFDDYIKANPNISGIFEVGKFITDNAPTVIPDIEAFDKALHKWFEDIEEWEKKNGKIRPQGEWVSKHLWDNTHIWVCSECGNRNIHGITVEKACWRCGAEMQNNKLFHTEHTTKGEEE